jgi:N-acetylmuramoyl-L-alanine amidase
VFVESGPVMDQTALTRRRLLALGVAAAGAQALEPAAALARPRAATVAVRLPRGRRLGPIDIPGGLELAGLRWPGDEHFHAELRSRRGPRGRWSQWLPLPHAHDHGPDFGVAHGTDPVWTGPAREIELRLSRPVDGLVLHGVRTHGARRITARAARKAQTQPGTIPPPLRIITRDEWGAAAVPPRSAPAHGEVRLAFVHHTVNGNDYGPEDSAAIVLAIARYHRNSNRWNDIGYNFLVDRYGQVFEGRAGGIDQPIVGAQAQGWNSYSTGIAAIGTHTVGGQTEAALAALSKLIAWKLAVHGAPVEGQVTVRSAGGEVNRYPAGRNVVFERVSGHRDGDKTECPGDALYAQLPELRTRAAADQRALGGPQAPATAGPVLALSLAANRVALPAEPRALGVLTAAGGGGGVGGAEISLQIQATTGRWMTVHKTRTSGDGTFFGPVPVRRNARVRARWLNGTEEVTSSVIPLTIVPRLRAKTSAKRIPAGGTVRVRVRVLPYRPRVDLVLARQLPDGRYVPAGRVRARVKGRRARAKIRLRRPGLYRIIAQAPRDRFGAAARAPWVFVRVLNP